MPPTASTSPITDDAAATPPSQLSDQELVVLESTLRVQLQVAKHVRVAKLTGALGVAALSGPLAAIPTGFTIVSSQVQRTKLKRRHRNVAREMAARPGLTPVVCDATRLGKRAIAISMATGLACCLLANSADVLIDQAVVEVVSEVFLSEVDELAMGALATHVTAQLTTTAKPPQVPSQQKQQEKHKPLKATRSWGGFAFKRRKPKKTESLPPDLFGEREPDLFGERELRMPQHIEVHRSSEFAPYGECLVLRFSTTVPGEVPPAQTEREIDMDFLQSRPRRTTIVGEQDALSEGQWLSLWTLEDGPMDTVEVDADDWEVRCKGGAC